MPEDNLKESKMMVIDNNINMEQQSLYRISNYRKINIALIVASIFFVVSPYLYNLIPTSIKCILIIIWHVNSFVFENKFKTFAFKSAFFVFLVWIFWCIFLRIAGYSSAEWGNYYKLIAMSDIIIKSLYVLKFYSDKEKSFLLRAIQMIFLVNIVHNVFIYILDPDSFVPVAYHPEAYMGTNKVSSALFYHALAFFVIGNVVLLRSEKILWCKTLAILSIFFSVFFMFSVVPRMNAIVVLILMLILYVLQNTKKTINRVFIVLLVPAILALGFLFADTMIESLPTRLRVRVESVLYVLNEEEYYAEGSLLSRGELQLNSLRTWLNNDFQTFFIGKGMHLGSEYLDIIGQHAFVTNCLAMYGCVGLLFVLYVFWGLRRVYLSAFEYSEIRQYANSVFFGFLFLLCISGAFDCIVGISFFLFFACMDKNFEERSS